MKHVTVAICTWNRADLLAKTLEQLESLVVPTGLRWELIVVNNRSTDHTAEVLETFANKHRDGKPILPLKIFFEPKQGHSHARNCAIQHATGDWILWTDDDVLVQPNWLVKYAKAIDSWDGYDFVGGTIEPWFESEPPNWLARHFHRLEGAFAIIRRDESVRPLKSDEAIFGANMGFRTQVLRDNLFDPELGLVRDQPMRGDETDLVERITERGSRGLWVGNAKVRHFVPTQRLNKSYLWKFFYGFGQAQIRLNQKRPTQPPVATWFGKPRWAVRGWLTSRLAAIFLNPFKSEAWLAHFQRAATCAGIIHESGRICDE